MSLPSGYTQLEYIECTGTQYIDTGVTDVSIQLLQINMMVEWLSGTGCFFGCNSPSGNATMWVANDTSVKASYMASSNTITLTTVCGKYRVTKSGVYFSANGVSTYFASSSDTINTSLKLLASYNGAGFADSARIYSCIVRKANSSASNDTSSSILRRFMPCKNASGVVGLWDDVNSVFYGNAGTGEFVAGPEIKVSGSEQKTLIDGAAYDIKSGRVLIDGTGYSIKKGRTLIDGTGYDINFATPLGELDEGTLVKLNEDGSPVEFYVAKHDYESGLNGTGRTLLVRKDCYSQRKYNSSATYFPSTDIYDWLNDDYYNLLDANVRAAIGTTKYKYFANFYSTTAAYGTNTSAVFLMSMAELFGTSEFSDGSKLPIADVLKIAYFEGSTTAQWTRSSPTLTNAQRVDYVAADGTQQSYSPPSVNYIGARPIFTLPSDIEFNSEFMLAD